MAAEKTHPTPADYPPVTPRARIGFIIPSSNRMVEPQIARFAPIRRAAAFRPPPHDQPAQAAACRS